METFVDKCYLVKVFLTFILLSYKIEVFPYGSLAVYEASLMCVKCFESLFEKCSANGMFLYYCRFCGVMTLPGDINLLKGVGIITKEKTT